MLVEIEGSEGFPQMPITSGLEELVIFKPVTIGIEYSDEVNGRSLAFGEEQDDVVMTTTMIKKRNLYDILYNSMENIVLFRLPNGPALSCGADNFRNATNETSSC
jgi:hypothetical protein